MFKTINARYAGTCKRCHQEFKAGDKIRYGGYGRTYHLKADCPEGEKKRENTGHAPDIDIVNGF